MHERFRYRNKEELLAKASSLGFYLPYSDDISPLFEGTGTGNHLITNRFVVQPMEGHDSMPDGSPSDLTRRRYLRYATGGSGTIWFEAVAVTPEGRSSPGQLWLNGNNCLKFRELNDEIRRQAGETNPLLVVQLTHSGRYSKPDGTSHPLVAAPNRILDITRPHVLTDSELMAIQDRYVEAAGYAISAGFDAIDIKACHGYLIIDLLSGKSRKDSCYGGEDASKRFRFFLETIDRIKSEFPGIMITTRLNVSDLYESGFGIGSDGGPDLSESFMLVEELKLRGINLINISMGSPYFNPHVTRPYDNPVPGQKLPEEHPLEGVMRMIDATAKLQLGYPEIGFVGSAYSWLRQFAPNVGAGVLRKGYATFIGLGRSSFAYPSMPAELKERGSADPSKVCITCSGCTRLIRALRPGGCVIRDKEIYGAELKKLIAGEKRQNNN